MKDHNLLIKMAQYIWDRTRSDWEDVDKFLIGDMTHDEYYNSEFCEIDRDLREWILLELRS